MPPHHTPPPPPPPPSSSNMYLTLPHANSYPPTSYRWRINVFCPWLGLPTISVVSVAPPHPLLPPPIFFNPDDNKTEVIQSSLSSCSCSESSTREANTNTNTYDSTIYSRGYGGICFPEVYCRLISNQSRGGKGSGRRRISLPTNQSL